jgi:hypothetical protein
MTPQLVAGLVALIGLVIFAAWCALAWLLDQMRVFGRSRSTMLVGVAGMGLLTLGARLALADGFVSWAPYLDQWDAEIAGLLLPLAHGTLGVADMVAPNNEHRVVLTRVLSLLSVSFNGEWDNRVEVLSVFILQALTVSWVSAVAWCVLGLARGTAVCLAMAVPMFLVCDWENLVVGFQVPFCIMILGSLVAFSLSSDPGGRTRYLLGACAAAVLVLGTLASGLLAALTIAGVAVGAAVAQRYGWRRLPLFCGAMAAIVIAGWMAEAHQGPGDTLGAQGVGDFLSAFLAYGAWPFPPSAIGFVLLWLPWSIFVVGSLRRRAVTPAAAFVTGTGLWVLLQAAAISFSRAGLSDLVRPRYTEILSLGLMVNAFAFLLLLDSRGQDRPSRMARILALALPIWLCCGAASEIGRSRTVYQPYLAGYRAQTLVYESRLGSFMRTGDEKFLTDTSFHHFPYVAERVVALARDPKVRMLLPAPMRQEFLRGHEPSAPAVVRAGPLTLIAVHAFRNGAWFLLAGTAMVLACFTGMARKQGRQ